LPNDNAKQTTPIGNDPKKRTHRPRNRDAGKIEDEDEDRAAILVLEVAVRSEFAALRVGLEFAMATARLGANPKGW
jgi:hypothetical protein